MTNVVDCADARMISVSWADGQSALYPYLWLIDSDGNVAKICFNAHIGDVVDLEPEELARFYPAYLTLMRMIHDPAYAVRLRLEAGEIVVFDNRRVLHGRSAFDPNTGLRHLHGCYVDRGDFDSRLRMMQRAH